MWFYLISPFFIRFRLKYLICLVVLSFAIQEYISRYLPGNTQWGYRFFPNEMKYFIFGIFAYRFYHALDAKLQMKRYGWYFLAALLFLESLSGLTLKAISFGQIGILRDMIIGVHTLLFLVSMPFIFASSRNSKWDNWIGSLSYPFYIIHMFCIDQLVTYSHWVPLLAAILGSILLVYIIEGPVDLIRLRISKKISPVTYVVP